MKYEVRDGCLHLSGYVNAVERDSKIIRDGSDTFVEQIQAGTFTKALRNNPNVKMKLNHRRIVNAELSLREDSIGLYAEAVTDDEEIMALAAKGALRGWSFGFFPLDVETEERKGKVPRHIVREMKLNEVSILSISPAYSGTSVQVRDDGTEAIRSEIAYRKAVACLAKHGRHIRPLPKMEYRDEGLTDDAESGNIDEEQRSNDNHVPAGSSKGGQFASKAQQALSEAIESGKVSTKLNKDRQAKHKKGSDDYKKALAKGEFPSYTELSHMEVQKIINEHSGKGRIIIEGDQIKEVVYVGYSFGYYGDRSNQKAIPTQKATIHYSKDGTHLVPTHPTAKT